ncbi:Similar to CEBPZ: CCAAT/enhancer-binding protein zeta (Homo sapiens) [Cotesia congregata]|uniref:Similar to CEBPZ: CCAAT/enhancer-binding protein zeta (Homo sapiens) n=1 Tax=Cotesia congregata TaxID=51543 RepID=A0A8J2HQL4_COTCN|nr:Similar to CEBPZ: CCAAT/enhancer-binding protein zeta (Homo sapiens) [Cotesia congregata]
MNINGIMNEFNSNDKKWYDEFPKETKACKHSCSEVDVIKLKEDAKKHLDAETAAFQTKKSTVRDSEYNWLKTAVTSGTNADKIGASIIFIQENPKCNLSRLVNLVSQVKGSRHSQSNLLITSLRDLFLSDLLHPQYKLLKFEEQNLDKVVPSNDSTIITRDVQTKKLLSYWYFEDQLREQYEKFILSLSEVASDTVDVNREKAVSVMTNLLIGNSEQEHQLLSLLVNKIGDPKSKVASKVIFCLNNLLLEHPNMKMVVLRELEKLLFRKNISQNAQYYAISLLTQFVLNREDADTATNLIDVYFAFFKACLKKGEPDSKMMAAILTGVNRAYRFANKEAIKINDHIDSIYKVVHVGSFNVSLNALSLLYQIVENDAQQERRFYTALYGKLFDPQIGSAKKNAVFLQLLFKAMKNDKSVTRLYAFVKRILQICLYFPASLICATLCIISQILRSRKDLRQILFKSTVAVKAEEKISEATENNKEKEVEEEIKSVSKTNKNKKSQVNIMLPNVTFDSTNTSETKEKTETEIKIEEDTTLIYDPFNVNPLKSGASKSPIIELLALSEHFHPSVALFSRNIIEGKTINYSGDPLEDLTLIRFLNRYVFKNPKKLEEKKVTNNGPLAVRAKYTPKGIRAIPVDSQAYLNEKEERIPVDELFLYRYLNKKNEIKSFVKKEKDDDDTEKFAEILERQGQSKQKQGSSNVLSDLDGASVKQLDWEIKRNHKISGKLGGKKRSKFSKAAPVSPRSLVRYIQSKSITPQIHRCAASLSAFEIQHKTPAIKKVMPIPKAHYGGRHTVTLLPGAGIGPELMGYVKEIFSYAGVPVDFEDIDIDPNADNNDDLEYAITSIRRNGVALKGNIETRSREVGVLSRNVALRNELDLYVNVLHCVSYPGVNSRQKNIDIVIVRQNTEGEYAMLEHESVSGVVESMKVITRSNSERLARYAFEYAKRNGRKKNFGDQYTVFEPGTRNTGAKIAGKNIANPIAMLNAAVDMLRHLGHKHHATIIQNAINKTINSGIHTADLGGNANSREVVDSIMKHIKIAVN